MKTALLNSSENFAIREGEFVELMPTWGYSMSAFVLFVIGFFGFFLNLIVIILMFKDKQLWTPLNVILFNLVCSDFSVSIFGNPFTLVSALSHHWIFGNVMCVIYGFFMTLLGITSITTLTVLSFERYMMVSKPIMTHQLTMKGASYTVALIWCYSLSVSIPPLIGWGSYVNEAANISCSVNWEEQTMNALTYILFLFVTGLIFPTIVISFSYMNIIRTMRKNTARMGRVQKAETRVTAMIFVMIITFMISWTPYSIFALLEQFAPSDVVSPGIGVIPALVAKSSICYNPIIYVGMNTQFRGSLKRMFRREDRDDSTAGRGANNTVMSPSRVTSHVNNDVIVQVDDRNKVEVSICRGKLNKNVDEMEMMIFQNNSTARENLVGIPKNSIVREFSASEVAKRLKDEKYECGESNADLLGDDKTNMGIDNFASLDENEMRYFDFDEGVAFQSRRRTITNFMDLKKIRELINKPKKSSRKSDLHRRLSIPPYKFQKFKR